MTTHGAAAPEEVGTAVRNRALWFLVCVIAYMACGVFLLDIEAVRDRFIAPWTRTNAELSASLATAIGVETTAVGTLVRSGSASLNIKDGCNGVHALLILISSVLAFPVAWRHRLLGVVIGALTVLGANLFRLLNLIVVARYFPEQLEFFPHLCMADADHRHRIRPSSWPGGASLDRLARNRPRLSPPRFAPRLALREAVRIARGIRHLHRLAAIVGLERARRALRLARADSG